MILVPNRFCSTMRANFGLGALVRPSEALVLRLHHVLAVASFEPANAEMPARHVLEMLDEGIVHSGAPERAENRDGLRRSLLRHHRSEAGGDLGQKAHENRSAFLDNT